MRLLKVNMPKHIGIIIDENSSCESNGLLTENKYLRREKKLKDICTWLDTRNIKYLTLYSNYVEKYLQQRIVERFGEKEISINILNELTKMNIKIIFIGDRKNLKKNLKEYILAIEKETSKCKGIILNVVFNYDGKGEIVNAIKDTVKDAKENKMDENQITIDFVEKHLYSAGLIEPEMILRIGGGLKTSDFLLWKSSYSELLFSRKRWLELNEMDLDNVIEEYRKRNINRGE